jgi:hypothetical protein
VAFAARPKDRLEDLADPALPRPGRRRGGRPRAPAGPAAPAAPAAPDAAAASSAPAASAPGAVEWTAVGGNDSITFYADLGSLAAEGDFATMWTMVDSKVQRSQGDVRFSSVTTRFAFDCAGQRIRSLETRFHAAAAWPAGVVGRYAEEGAW